MIFFMKANNSKDDVKLKTAMRTSVNELIKHQPTNTFFLTVSFSSTKSYALSPTLLRKNIFLDSKLGQLYLTQEIGKTMFLNNQIEMTLKNQNEISINCSKDISATNIYESLFERVIDYMMDKNPLESCSFQEFQKVYRNLIMFFNMLGIFYDSVYSLIPYRLYTNYRWTDLVGTYALSRSDVEFLRMKPVALQLNNHEITPMYQMKHYCSFLLTPHDIRHRIFQMLPSNDLICQIVSIYCLNDSVLVMINSEKKFSSHRRQCPFFSAGFYLKSLFQTNIPDLNQKNSQTNASINEYGPVEKNSDKNVDNEQQEPLEKSIELFYQTIKCCCNLAQTAMDSLEVTQILIKIDSFSPKVLTYDFSTVEKFDLSLNENQIYMYTRNDRVIFHISSTFSIEVEMIKDSVSSDVPNSLKKMRRGLCRYNVYYEFPESANAGKTSNYVLPATFMIPNHQMSLTQNAISSAAPHFPLGNLTTAKKNIFYNKTPHSMYGSKRMLSWICMHPLYKTIYHSNMKCSKEFNFNEISRVKFYTWGTLITSSKVDSLFGIIVVEDSELLSNYPDKIYIYLRGFSTAGIKRQAIDVTVTPGFERIYLCCCSQIASSGIMPQTTKIEFEIQELPNKKHCLKLVHIDIPEGAPSGQMLGSLYSLGILAEYCPKTGFYYQSDYCQQMCPCLFESEDEQDLKVDGDFTVSTIAGESPCLQLDSKALVNPVQTVEGE